MEHPVASLMLFNCCLVRQLMYMVTNAFQPYQVYKFGLNYSNLCLIKTII